MTKIKLDCIDGTLYYSNLDIPKDCVDALINTIIYSQAVARALSPDIYSEEYFNAMNRELEIVGWNIINSGKVDFKKSTSAFSMEDVILDSMSAHIEEANKAGILKKFFDMIQKSTKSDIDKFCEFWWNKVNIEKDKSCLAIGSLVKVQEDTASCPRIICMYYLFKSNQKPTTTAYERKWNSLFVKQPPDMIELKIVNLEMELNWDSYVKVKDDIEEKIRGKIADHAMQLEIEIG